MTGELHPPRVLTYHEETSTNTGEAALETKLLGDLDQTGGGTLTGETLGLVDLGEHGVGGLGDDGGSETSKETSAKVDTSLTTVGEGVLVDNREDSLGELLESDELGHGVRNPAKKVLSNRSGLCRIWSILTA